MTNQEKQQIIKLKKEGMSYSTIASITGFNESTIKTIYSRSKRNQLKKKELCPICGKPLIQTRGHRQKKYCSNKCKDKYWSSARRGGSNEQ